MATKKTKKAVVKLPGEIYVTNDASYGDFYIADTVIDRVATDVPVLVGVYHLVGYKTVTKSVEIKVEDVNG